MKCPVCELEQVAAESCAQCGTTLVIPPPSEVLAVPMAELEGTRFAGDLSATMPVELVPGLEATRMESPPIPPVPEGLGIELDSGRADAVGEIAADRFPELEPTRAEDRDARTTVSLESVTCRYCRKAGKPGRFCEGCGMKLPKIEAAGAEQRGGGEVVRGRCPGCGAISARGAPCTDCGVLVPGGES